jgi:hypothetical protein
MNQFQKRRRTQTLIERHKEKELIRKEWSNSKQCDDMINIVRSKRSSRTDIKNTPFYNLNNNNMEQNTTTPAGETPANIIPKAETAVTDQALLDEWEAMRPKPEQRSQFNEIYIDNKKNTEDGELNPCFGKIFARTAEEEHEVDISVANFFPVKYRVQVNSVWDEAANKSDYFCREVDDLSYIEVIDSSTKEVVATGSFFDLRKEYQLSTTDIFYVAYAGQVYRWRMKVGGYEIVNSLKKSLSKISHPTCFKVKSITPTSKANGATWFNTVEFELGEKIDVKLALELIEQLNEAINAYKSSTEDGDKIQEAAQETFVKPEAPSKDELLNNLNKI